MTWLDDSSGSAHLIQSQAGVALSTAQAKFGTQSAYFAGGGTAAMLYSSDTPTDWNFGAGQFTVEGWAYFTSHGASNFEPVVAQWPASPNLGWWLGMAQTGVLAFYYSTTGSDTPSVSAAYSPTLNTWIHLAADRDASNVLRVYAGGTVIASATVSSTLFASAGTLYVGNDANASRRFPGYIDEVRVSKGVARYGGAFTPPSSAFTSDANTSLLLHFEGGNPSARGILSAKYAVQTAVPIGNGARTPQFMRSGGTGATVSGVVKEQGVPVAGKIVCAYDKISRQLIAQTTSAGDGSYTINCGGFKNVYVAAFDPTTYKMIGYDEVVPG
jgi:hypothetical protein